MNLLQLIFICKFALKSERLQQISLATDIKTVMCYSTRIESCQLCIIISFLYFQKPPMMSVMVNIVCQLNWIIVCPDVCLGIIFKCVHEDDYWRHQHPNQVAWLECLVLLYVTGHHPIFWRPEQNKKVKKGEITSLPYCLFVFSCTQTGIYIVDSPGS